jgi:DNA-directed RNA polymerase specialized sigma24 family protein
MSTTDPLPAGHTLDDAALQQDLARAHAAARAMLGCDHLAADAVQEALVA